MTFTASKISGALGVYFRGRDGSNAHMWQLSQSSQSLRPHVKTNGNYAVLSATPFPAGFDFAAAHEYSITVNWHDRRDEGRRRRPRHPDRDANTAPGLVGFRTSGDEKGTVSDVKVTSKSGSVLLDTTFPSGDRSFTAGTVQGGNLVVSGNTDSWFAFGADVPVLRTEFDVDKEVESARIYAAALGLYELQLNGERVGDHELAPGWTDYNKRIQYQTYDVTDQIDDGDNAFGAELGDGWYAGRVAMFGDRSTAATPRLIAQLRITYTDGIRAGRRHRRHAGAPRRAHDVGRPARRRDVRRATRCRARGLVRARLRRRRAGPPVVERPSATAEARTADRPAGARHRGARRQGAPEPGGRRARLRPRAEHGRPRPGDAHRRGRPDRAHPRTPRCSTPTARSTPPTSARRRPPTTTRSRTDGAETYEPKFTFHGFRYVEITGVDEAPPRPMPSRASSSAPTAPRPRRSRPRQRLRQPAAEQHRLGPARQLPVDPDRHARA